MKKLLLLSLVLLMALPLFGCMPNYPADTFFSDEWLAESGLADLPVPQIENSRLDGKSLCLNLTEAEYEAYVAELVAYLRGREDVHHLSFYVSRYLMGEIAPVDVCAPLPEEYDCSADRHEFVFSYTAELSENQMMRDPVRITGIRDVRGLFRGQFTYNTEILLQASALAAAEVDPCAAQHTYDEGTAYPIPGWERSITRYTCIYCGDTKQSEYLDSRKSYAVTVAQGRNYILSNNWNQVVAWDIDSLHAGGTLEITVRRATTGSTALLVNGESIPVLREDKNTQTFGFIMPESDVTIEIFPTETE